MARRDLRTTDERQKLFGVATDRENLARHYMLSSLDRALIATRRGETNQIGFAVQLGLLRHPGFGFTLDEGAPIELFAWCCQSNDHLSLADAGVPKRILG